MSYLKKRLEKLSCHLTPAAKITSLRQHTRQKRGFITNFGCDEAAILFTTVISMADVYLCCRDLSQYRSTGNGRNTEIRIR